MAVTKSNALNLLTAAALALPLTTVFASDEEAYFQYGHYEDGARNLFTTKSAFKPIQVDSMQSGARLKLSDRVRLAFNYTQDTWSGATPMTTAPLAFSPNRESKTRAKTISGASPYLQPSNLYVDKQFNPLQLDLKTKKYSANNQLVHTLSTASPETRKQGDVRIGYDWDEASLDGGAGTSVEPDYESFFGNVGLRLDFNQKLTSLNLGASYTASETNSMLDHDAAPYIEASTFGNRVQTLKNGVKLVTGSKEDWTGSLGLTQVLNKSALIEGSVSYTASNGYMSNPYKVVEILFVDPNKKADADGKIDAKLLPFLEQRPEQRNQWTENLRFVQHIDALDAALHLDYRFYHDDWGINAHTISGDWIQPMGDGWSVTPRVRYYSQDAADFYAPYLLSKQAASTVTFDDEGNIKRTSYNPKLFPKNYSSDYRLSGYGALSGGLTVTKKFAKGLELQAGAEYYTHAGSLKLGGEGEGNYADFDGYLVNASMSVDLTTLATANSAHSEHSHHAHHSHHHGVGAPAGVMFDHVLPNSGDVMIGYRYMYANQAGQMQSGTTPVSDKTLLNQPCDAKLKQCFVTPQEMSMNMHMLDLMYAPTDWLTLMLMPQFMDMHMAMRDLNGAADLNMLTPLGAAVMHSRHEHTTGGVGDTGLYALFNVLKFSHQQINVSLGISAPTGDSAIQLRDTHQQDLGFIHYGMQLGSGTWDFKPAITYTANIDDWSFGAQLNGTKRLENQSKSGFAWGDIFQATSWGSYSWTNWLATSVRGVYILQGALNGSYKGVYHQIGAMDFPNSYGGRFVDVGFGVAASMPDGSLQGNRISFEWLQPVHDDVNGYQLPREGALSATWSYMF